MTSFISQDPAMISAYVEGKDLYAMIAQSAFDNKYEENLEFWPAGTELVIDGEKVIAGDGKPDCETEVSVTEPLKLKSFNILELKNGKDVQAAFLKVGDTLVNDFIISNISINDKDVTLSFEH